MSVTQKTIINANISRIIKFLLVGGFTAILYLSIFGFFEKICLLNYHIAISIAYIISITIYFFANKYLTFNNTDKSITPQLIRFSGMIAINYLITLLIVHSSVEFLQLSAYIGTMISIVATTVLNYIIAKSWVFR